jgi:hypothetical protein
VPPHTARGPATGEDWHAVADALNARMAALRIGQQALSATSGVSVSTLRQLQHGVTGRRVQNKTLTAVARALDWPDDHLIAVLLAGRRTDPAGGTADAQILAVLLRIEQRLADLADRLIPCAHGAAPPTGPGHDDGPDPAGT